MARRTTTRVLAEALAENSGGDPMSNVSYLNRPAANLWLNPDPSLAGLYAPSA